LYTLQVIAACNVSSNYTASNSDYILLTL